MNKLVRRAYNKSIKSIFGTEINSPACEIFLSALEFSVLFF